MTRRDLTLLFCYQSGSVTSDPWHILMQSQSNPALLRVDAASLRTGRGEPLPFGLHEVYDGYNFAVFSRHATRISLLLFEGSSDRPIETIDLDSNVYRTGDVWHVHLNGAVRGKSYALRVDGPWNPEQGHRFNPQALLLDPYAKALVGSYDWDSEQLTSIPTASTRVFGARGLVARDRFDWQGDKPPRNSWQYTIIYETHVRGLTVDDSSHVTHCGRYLGMIEKIPYLQELGVTAVELMPVQEFRECEIDPWTGRVVRNYWGYNPVALFAPKASYASGDSPDAALTEFKTMVRELHRAGMEIILDVVFNHTAEGNENGSTFSFRGLDNSIYYLLEPKTHRYVDYTGCGNTLNCNHPVVRSFIVDCLRYWVVHMHVDGFRFDLASILGRDTEGRLLPNPPLLEQIAEDPVLRHVKLIAEAWDLGGAFQVGHFPGQRWAEWNSDFRDDVRRFWRGDPGMTGAFATRLCGSADLYQAEHETPVNSINYITCHDGFTLNDLVSYARKHNEPNGENNRDGMTENFSENNGIEGPTSNANIEAVRLRQIRNMLTTLFLARGVPMLLGGDEFRRTQQGNNNAYCQDNATSWFDWRLVDQNADLVRFVIGLIAFRKAHPVLSAERFYTDAEIQWLGADGGPPQWHGRNNCIGCVLLDRENGPNARLCLLFNAALTPTRFLLPPPSAGAWRVTVDTAHEAGLAGRGSERILVGEITLVSRSAMVLTSS
jgi:isoamylase